MLKHCGLLVAGSLVLTGCNADRDNWLDTTADESFMDRPTTMESPPTADRDDRWPATNPNGHSARSATTPSRPTDRNVDRTADRAVDRSRDRSADRATNEPNDLNRNIAPQNESWRRENAGRNDVNRNDVNRNDAPRRDNLGESRNMNPPAAARVDADEAWDNVSDDVKILSILHAKNQEEIEAGRLAQDRGTSEEVRSFGEHMVKDHTDADKRVQNVARERNLSLLSPSEVKQKMMAKKREDGKTAEDPIAKLRQLQGAEFDREFARCMQKGHAELIEKVEKAREKCGEDVRALLDEILPTLRHHHEMAKELPTT